MRNVVEALKMLNEGENYFIKVDNYQRIGNKVVDEFDVFERREVAVPTPFELIGNENRLNLSVQNKVYGTVTLNPKQAKRVGLPNKIDGPMSYKTKTIIRDGKLNAEKLELIVDMATYMQLKKNGLKFEQLENKTTYPGFCIILDLSGMDIAGDKTVNYSLDEILLNVTTINELKAKQKVINALKDKLPTEAHEAFPGFTEEQTEMLKDHGLNDKLQYIGVENTVKDTEETYAGTVIGFKVKGSSMSSFSTMLKRVQEGKKLNALDTIQYEFYKELNDKVTTMELIETEDIRMFYKAEVKKIKGQLFNIRLKNVMIKMAFLASPLQEVAFDTEGNFNYKGILNVSFKDETFTK